MEQRSVRIHGRELAYRTGGEEGPLAVLIHGITQDASTWERMAPLLAERARVVALDLPGHGNSEPPPGDHSMGAYASTVRDLLFALGESSATIVGHSLGGGVALQFAYQFPECTERLVLIDSGGLGPEVSPLLRAASLPGADPVIALLSTDSVKNAMAGVARGLQRLGLQLGTDLESARRGFDNLADPEARRSFLRTVRTSVGLSGQLVSASDRLYLAEHVPTLIVWGARDRIIPLAHATDAHAAIPGSRLKVVRGAGHFPHVDAPGDVAAAIVELLAQTEPATLHRGRWGELLDVSATGETA